MFGLHSIFFFMLPFGSEQSQTANILAEGKEGVLFLFDGYVRLLVGSGKLSR